MGGCPVVVECHPHASVGVPAPVVTGAHQGVGATRQRAAAIAAILLAQFALFAAGAAVGGAVGEGGAGGVQSWRVTIT